MSDKEKDNVVPFNFDSPANVLRAVDSRGADDVDSIIVITKNKDGAWYLSHSSIPLETLAFAATFFQQHVTGMLGPGTTKKR